MNNPSVNLSVFEYDEKLKMDLESYRNRSNDEALNQLFDLCEKYKKNKKLYRALRILLKP